MRSTLATTTDSPETDPATRADVLIDLGIQAGLNLAAQRTLMTRIAHAAALAPDGDLDPCDPLAPATRLGAGLTVPCPIHAWCAGHEHGETVTAASLHFSAARPAPAAALYLHLDALVPSVAFAAQRPDLTLLDPDEADSLAAALALYAAAARSVTR